MGNVHLVTGYAGEDHVTAEDQGAFNALLFGSGQFVLDKGNKLAASIVTNNQVRLLDGEIFMQGRYIRTVSNYVDLTIENGNQGYLRNDLIVARYTKDGETGVEDCNLVVIKGTPVESNPADPEYTAVDIMGGASVLNDMPLFRVQLNGLEVQPLVQLFEVGGVQGGEGKVKTVNDTEPDENGNVEVKVGVKTIDGVEPDEDGNIKIEPAAITAFDVQLEGNTMTVTVNREDGTADIIPVTLDDDGWPVSMTVNGAEVPVTMGGF